MRKYRIKVTCNGTYIAQHKCLCSWFTYQEWGFSGGWDKEFATEEQALKYIEGIENEKRRIEALHKQHPTRIIPVSFEEKTVTVVKATPQTGKERG